MRVLVTGASGALGSAVVAELAKRNHECIPVTRTEFDISDPESSARIAAGEYGQLDWCINCAAYTKVDLAETHEQEAYGANALGVAYLSQMCSLASCGLIHISTDFVFDGSASAPYTEEDIPNPLSAYGRTKLAGEKSVLGYHRGLVVRTSWVFGPTGSNFPKTMLNAYRAGKSLRVVSDQVGNPTYTLDLARVLIDLMEMNAFPGIYHACGPETMSWYDFAKRAISVCTGEEADIEAIATSDWPTPAKRPHFSVLSTEKLLSLGVSPMRRLQDALQDFCKGISAQ